MEYHAFGIISYVSPFNRAQPGFVSHDVATISEGVHAKEHYLICGVQGDFTQSLVDRPPTHLWTRQLKVGSHRIGHVEV